MELVGVDFAEQGNGLRGPFGQVWNKDVIAFHHTDAGFAIGFAQQFFKASDGRIFASVDMLRRITEATYDTRSTGWKKCLVPAQSLWGAFPYLPLDDNTIFLVASVDTFER